MTTTIILSYLPTLTPLCRWVQEKYAIPAGRLTEGTLERGHQLVMQCKKSFSRCKRCSKYFLFGIFLNISLSRDSW